MEADPAVDLMLLFTSARISVGRFFLSKTRLDVDVGWCGCVGVLWVTSNRIQLAAYKRWITQTMGPALQEHDILLKSSSGTSWICPVPFCVCECVRRGEEKQRAVYLLTHILFLFCQIKWINWGDVSAWPLTAKLIPEAGACGSTTVSPADVRWLQIEAASQASPFIFTSEMIWFLFFVFFNTGEYTVQRPDREKFYFGQTNIR